MSLRSRIDDALGLIGADVKALRTAQRASAGGITIPVGFWGVPNGLMSSGSPSPTVNVADFQLYTLGPDNHVIDYLSAVVTTATAGGSGVAVRAGLWPALPSGLPDFTSPLITGDVPTLTSIGGNSGRRDVVPGSPVTLPPGRYFAGSLYTYTSAPTTAPALLAGGNTLYYPLPSFGSTSTVQRSFRLSTPAGTFPTSNAGLTWLANTNNNAIVVALHRSA